ILGEILLEPMFLLLLVAAGLYFSLGDFAEAVFLLGSVLVVIGLAFFQERRTQRALEALRELSAPRALVVRDGERVRVAGAQVVRGDLLVLGEGERVAADAVLLEGTLAVDESLLTGESSPAQKLPDAAATAMAQPGEEGPSLFASTLVVRGRGFARVCATGGRTAVGAIGRGLAGAAPQPSPLQRESRRIVRLFGTLAVAFAALLTLLAWRWDGQSPVASLLSGIALAMALLPAEIPMVLTVMLAMGAWRLSQRKVLVRRVQAVEALGGITVLAVDKTGTLTLNRMEVAALQGRAGLAWNAGDSALGAPLHDLAEFAQLATPREPHDPMELAIRAFCARFVADPVWLPADSAPEREYPMTPEILAMTRVYARADPGRHLLATKGAPEAVADLCHLPPADRDAIRRDVEALAARGLRVLAVARGEWRGVGEAPAWPADQHVFDFEFLGLVGLVDPPRPEVPSAVAACRGAGIRVLMMTGDHPATASAIAARVGLPAGEVLTGVQIDAIDDAALTHRLRHVQVCARLQPSHKLRLVRCLQAAGERVGMTGDGVNDAPALAAADVGIAMGGRGTDVAREAAALVLLDDSFASIVEAVRGGRRIRHNLRGAMRFVFAVHVPVVALALGPVLWHWPVLLLPAHIVLLELLIDPACSLLFEAEPAPEGLMRTRPAQSHRSPFAPANAADGLLQGAGLATALLGGTWLLLRQEHPPGSVRAVFLALVAAVGLLALVQLSRDADHRWLPNPWAALPFVALALLLLLAAVSPAARGLLAFGAPDGTMLLAIVLLVLPMGLWLAAVRVLRHSVRRDAPA
ncbi:MAG: cation-translocating P-type ATPase, partial [Ramlibacter sp.]